MSRAKERGMSNRTTRVTRASANVFADLDLPNADERLLKARIAIVIRDRINQLGLTQVEAAVKLGIAQPDVSCILRGRLSGFSLERLICYVRALGNDVEIKVRPAKNREKGRLLMTA